VDLSVVETSLPCYSSRVIRVLILLLGLLPGLVFAQLQKFEKCSLVETEWADGDSFQVLFPDGNKQTVRLYGVDCIEMHVQGDDSNARRLRDQRRYFGIDDILVAKSIGQAAKAETIKLLEKPFIVHTTFADGRGDGRFSRIYAFVELADGRNLSEILVGRGLARAFGVVRQLPDGTRGDEWHSYLNDLELTAARAGLGAWAQTDWKKLPEARKQAREENAELEAAKGTRKAAENQPIDINLAARDQLMTLPGVGEKTAAAIIGKRPFKKIAELLDVEGVGPSTLKKIQPFITIGSDPPSN
jgi:competence protein ComEA